MGRVENNIGGMRLECQLKKVFWKLLHQKYAIFDSKNSRGLFSSIIQYDDLTEMTFESSNWKIFPFEILKNLVSNYFGTNKG